MNKFQQVLRGSEQKMGRCHHKGCAVLRNYSLVGVQRASFGHGDKDTLYMLDGFSVF